MRRDGDFSLPPSERALYGATITARSLDSDETITLARTHTTAVEAVAELCDRLEAYDCRYRVVSISTPVSIARDMYASRISLGGNTEGTMKPPEVVLLGQADRLHMLHPDVDLMTQRNSRPRPNDAAL